MSLKPLPTEAGHVTFPENNTSAHRLRTGGHMDGWCGPTAGAAAGRDPAAEATRAKAVPAERPEQKQTEHDKSEEFDWKKPAPLTPALKDQPNGGRITGFDFSRDPLGADKPFTHVRRGDEEGDRRPSRR